MLSIKPYLILVCLVLIQTTKAECINSYFAGDTLTVWAEGGLTLRDAPSIKGNKVVIIPYGQSLKVLDTNQLIYEKDSVKFIYSTSEFKEYYLKGRWAKVIYDGKTGYVFDAYLSHFSAPELQEGGSRESLKDFMERVFGLLGSSSQFNDEVGVREQYFGYGCSYYNWCSKSSFERFILPALSLEEVIMFIKNSKKASNINGQVMLKEMQDKGCGKILTFLYFENGDGSLEVHLAGGIVIIFTESVT
ncbi:MAG: SH3 domain-containing protein [Saprospiraceae bacterium]|nr:SH3 domain-containing protein [Saprospiraceae bacterium]MCB9344810.1 SH3 domain-containing protein [Lewinellaceae bacterium]